MHALPPHHPFRNLARGAGILFLVTALAFVLLGSLVQAADLTTGIWFTQIGLFLVPAVLFSRAYNLKPARWLGFVPALTGPVLAAVLVLSVGNYLVAAAGMGLLDRVLPESWHLVDVEDVLGRVHGLRLGLVLTGVVVLAPIAEEAVFRGFLQRGLVARFGPWPGIALTALAFSALHLDPVGFLPRLELGLVFGWLAWRTGSLWASVVAHAVNNGTAALIYLATGAAAAEAAASTQPASLWVPLLFAVGLGLLLALPAAAALLSMTERPTPPTPETLPRLDPTAPVALRRDSPEAFALVGLFLASLGAAFLWLVGLASGAA